MLHPKMTSTHKKFFNELYKLCVKYKVDVDCGGVWRFPSDPVQGDCGTYSDLEITGSYPIAKGNEALTVDLLVNHQIDTLRIMGKLK